MNRVSALDFVFTGLMLAFAFGMFVLYLTRNPLLFLIGLFCGFGVLIIFLLWVYFSGRGVAYESC